MNTPNDQFRTGIFSLSYLGLCMAAVACNHAFSADTAVIPKTTVTASLVQSALSDVVGDVLVIDKQDIQAHQGQSALEVLESQPSIAISRSGGLGTVSGISLRGNKNQHTLVLINGVRYGSASVGGSALGLIPASQVERIEVLYGSGATSLYGSDAVGGVVQVFTKKARYKNVSASLTAGGGSHQSATAQGFASYGGESVRVGVGASYDKTGGVSAIAKADPKNKFDSYESDKDSFENQSVNLDAGVKLSKHAELSLSGIYGTSKTQFDGGNPKHTTHSKQENGAAAVNLYAQLNNLELQTKLGFSVDDVKTPAFKSRFKTTQQQAKAIGSYKAGFGTFSLGAEHVQQKLTSTTKLTQTERTITSALAGYQLAGKHVDAQLNVRMDNTKDQDNELTYSAGLAYAPAAGMRFGGAYATGFRMPTFNDLYYPLEKYGSSSYQGNPNLQPEKSKNAEIFAEFSGSEFLSRLTLFQNQVDNLIAYGSVPSTDGGNVGTMVNINQATINGVSLRSNWEQPTHFAGFHYNYLDAQDDKTNKQLSYRAKHAGAVYAGLKSKNYRLKAEVAHTGKRYADAANASTLDAYTLVNLSGNMKLSKYVDANVSVNNLFGERYELVKNYSTLGTHAMMSLTVHTP